MRTFKRSIFLPLLILYSLFCLIERLSAAPIIPESILHSRGISPSDIRIDQSAQKFLGGTTPLKFPRLLLEQPLTANEKVAPLVKLAAQYSKLDSFSPSVLFGVVTALLDRPVVRLREYSPLDRRVDESLEVGHLSALLNTIGGKITLTDLNKLPPAVIRSLYVILSAALSANLWANLAQESVVSDLIDRMWSMKEVFLFNPYADSFKNRIDFRIYTKSLEQFNLTPLLIPTFDILYTLEWVESELQKLKPVPNFGLITIETTLGQIEIGDSGRQEYGRRDPFIILDLGGNDRYFQAGANNPSVQPVSIAFDLSGDDIYEVSKPGLGVGTLGVGVLWDNSGNDSYLGGERSIASAEMGVGILIDKSGDDSYLSEFESQSAALSGAALLLDGSGNDRYRSFVYSQGFGGPYGAALLVDGSGDDVYEGEDREIRFPASQDKRHNVSMVQGAGSGIRPFKKGAINLPGGTGLLMDLSGDDSYSAGVFAQGVGFWYGAGILIDSSGNDNFQSHWYGAGAGAHFGFGMLVEEAGDDSYAVTEQMGLGAGHDVAVGVLLDRAGDDRYEISRLGLGSSHDAGIGVFSDLAGRNTFIAEKQRKPGEIWGIKPGDPRSRISRWGLFYEAEHGE